MAEWLNTPLIIPAALAVLAALWAVHRWLAKVDHAAREFPKFVKEIRDDIEKIRTNIAQIFERLPAKQPTAPGSPLKLTAFGREIAEKLQAEAWAETLSPTLRDRVANMQPFEIDAYAEDYSKRHLSDDMKTRVAACAYEFGTTQDGVKSVLRVVLRDALLRLIEQAY